MSSTATLVGAALGTIGGGTTGGGVAGLAIAGGLTTGAVGVMIGKVGVVTFVMGAAGAAGAAGDGVLLEPEFIIIAAANAPIASEIPTEIMILGVDEVDVPACFFAGCLVAAPAAAALVPTARVVAGFFGAVGVGTALTLTAAARDPWPLAGVRAIASVGAATICARRSWVGSNFTVFAVEICPVMVWRVVLGCCGLE